MSRHSGSGIGRPPMASQGAGRRRILKRGAPLLSVLFLCTGNSARSILAEALLNHLGQGRMRAFSAGSHPTGQVNPNALALLARLGIPVGALRSKSWDEFARPQAPQLDAVITVCDSAAGEVCPIWPGHPVTAHWGVADPAAVTGTRQQVEEAFCAALGVLDHRIRALLELPCGVQARAELESRLREIGGSLPSTSSTGA